MIEDDESETRSAIRTIASKVPGDWMREYREERENTTGGIAFSSRKNARAFYRGDWIIRRGESEYERIDIRRFGGLGTTADRSLDGQWRLSGQDLFMRWDDGMRKILSPVGHGFVLYEYRPGRPLDGVPTRVLAAAPADSGKFAEHLEGRVEVAEQMKQMAAAAGIDPAEQEDTGWGRSFARWVWPFEGESESASAEEMLAEEFEQEAGEEDPWWWPFWSERPESQIEADEAQAEEPVETAPESLDEPDAAGDATVDKESPTDTSAEGLSEAAEQAAPATSPEPDTQTDSADDAESVDSPSPEPGKKKSPASARDWVWPF